MIDKNLLNQPEYDFLRTNPYLGDNIVLLGLGGSYAYGTNIEGSDIDIRGIATRTCYDICTGYDFEEIVNNETDTTVYSFDKMIKLLSECNPNCIEILGLRDEDYLYKTKIGQILIDNRHLFLSKRCIHTFGGYATQQLYRLRQKTLDALSSEEYDKHIIKVIEGMKEHLEKSWNIPGDAIQVTAGADGLCLQVGNMTNVLAEDFYGMCNEISNVIRTYNKQKSKRNDQAIAHAKVHKHAMHLLRLYLMVIDILRYGEIVTYREREHDLLMAIRNGEYTDPDTGMMNKAFWDLIVHYENEFNIAKIETRLPDNPDMDLIKRIQFDINRSVVTRI